MHALKLYLTLLILVLAGCTTLPSGEPTQPQSARIGLRLTPASLGETIAVQQHLKVERNGRIDELDAALEVDSNHLDLVGLSLGQRVLSLSYDGKELKSWRHAMLPAQVHAEDVLEDLQLTMWPLDAIKNALPPGWRVEDSGLHRTVFLGDTPVTVIDYRSLPRWQGQIVLENLRFHYRLTIQSVPIGS